MTTFTAHSAADVANIVPAALGFVPTDSLVVIGTGNTPTARVDLPRTAADAVVTAEGLLPALPYWQGHPVIVAIYSPDPTPPAALAVVRVLADVLDVVEAFRVHGNQIIALDESKAETFEPRAVLDERATAYVMTRDDLAASTQHVTDPAQAEREAWDAFKRGDGAAAWVWHDRVTELTGGATPPAMSRLADLLTRAVNPAQTERCPDCGGWFVGECTHG